MTTVAPCRHDETTVTVSRIPNKRSMVELEAQIGEALQLAGKNLMIRASRVVETHLLKECLVLRRSKLRRLHMLADPLRVDLCCVRDYCGV